VSCADCRYPAEGCSDCKGESPRVIHVTGCHDCPFADSGDDSGYTCQLTAPPRMTYAFSDIQQPDRPAWCPLAKAGQVVVKAAP
jgi:hypothetical protein